ncbi:MAG: SDR family oxidoreductase [Oscillospiraceae bacterium]|nr:SDR family oxidoreductase [Oscillospiraceae bacterium]
MKKQKTALVTGATGGLGAHFANELAKAGYDLLLVGRNEEKLEHLQHLFTTIYPVQVHTLQKDLSEPGAGKEVFAFAQENELTVEVLVNNAGFGDFGAFAFSDWKKQQDMVMVNCTALLELTRCFLLPMLTRRSGKILNVASMASFQPGPLMSVYYATKAFVLSFTEALSVELRGTGVTVTALCPGPTKTGFEKNAALGSSGLFRNLGVAKAKDVAKYGLKKLRQGKVIAVPGCKNRMIVRACKVLPRGFVRNMVYEIQK